MDCNKLAEIYLRSCGKQDEKDFFIYTYYLRRINVTNNDNVCLKSMKLFTESCNSHLKSYKEIEEYKNKT
jgi:hypothetical protein